MPTDTITTAAPLRLVAYLRVSTEDQLNGYGLELQEDQVRGWAARNNAVITEVRTEPAVSGAALDRPELIACIQDVIDREADGILLPNLERIARELHVQEAAMAAVWAEGGAVYTADHGEVLEDDPEDPVRTAMRQMRGVFSQLERGLIRKRLHGGRRKKAAKGEYVGGPVRYGYDRADKNHVANEAEQRGRERARELKAEGLSLQKIADTLTAEEIPTKRGGRWQKTTVARLLDDDVRAKRNAADGQRMKLQREQDKRGQQRRKGAILTG
ncbi:recombinase family protein [Streptomyces sp. NPDC059835]|uniref:recombinase family protein n=1 Tax=Streptomyces sp. NPDC059835 TaxID=3346967 RepID=UPI00365B2E01